jgi:hypothetical protein
MTDNVLDRIANDLRKSGTQFFPEHSEVKAVRVVGRTPNPEQYTYELALDFADGSERVSAKIYRAAKGGTRGPQEVAKSEARNLNLAYEALEGSELGGVPRPVGDFAELGAVVSTKVDGLSLQSIILKAALLPDFGNDGLLEMAAHRAGEWLHQFHRATAAMPAPLDTEAFLAEMEKLCAKARKSGLPEESTEAILERARAILREQENKLNSSAVLHDFVPLNVLISERGVGFSDFANLRESSHSLEDVAIFLAAVEALAKYPFCDRRITALVEGSFVQGYGMSEQEQELLPMLKMKVLLQMFAQGRTVKETGARKKVMWANVMQRFIQQAAERSLARAA